MSAAPIPTCQRRILTGEPKFWSSSTSSKPCYHLFLVGLIGITSWSWSVIIVCRWQPVVFQRAIAWIVENEKNKFLVIIWLKQYGVNNYLEGASEIIVRWRVGKTGNLYKMEWDIIVCRLDEKLPMGQKSKFELKRVALQRCSPAGKKSFFPQRLKTNGKLNMPHIHVLQGVRCLQVTAFYLR